MRRFIDIVSPISTPRPNLLAELNKAAAQRLDEAKAYATMMHATQALINRLGEQYDGRVGRDLTNRLLRCMQFADGLRQDRAVWFLREVRIFFLFQTFHYSAPTIHPQEAEGWDEFKAQGIKLHAKYEAEFKRQTNGGLHSFPAQDIAGLVHSIEHYQGVPYSKLQSYVFPMSKDWHGVHADLVEIENEFIERARGKVTMKEGDEVILELPGDYVWVKLSRAACGEEAKAMGHCGNSPRAHTCDRILSLRHLAETIDKVQYMEPCLTFILYPDGYLGEMKGKGNLKPAEHYHDAIEALLRTDHIKGIVSDGYLPQNNFSLNDMDYDRAENLLAHNDKLVTPVEAYQRYGLTGRVAELFRDSYEKHGWVNFNRTMGTVGVNYADRATLMKMYPTPAELYKAEGMSDRFINQARIAFKDGKHADHYSLNFETNRYKSKWFDKDDAGTKGLKAESFSEEDKKKFFEAVPEALMPRDFMEIHGLTDEFLYECLSSVGSMGQIWFVKHGIDVTKWSDKDQARLASTNVNELATKLGKHPEFSESTTPDMLAPFRWWNRVHGGTDQPLLMPELDSDATLEDKVEYAVENWGSGNIYEFPTEVDGFWKIGSWDSLEDFVKAVTEDDHDLRDVVKVEPDSSYNDYYTDEDSWHCDNFDDVLPLQWLLAVRKYAENLQTEFVDDEDDHDDLDSWSAIWSVIKEHDDELKDIIVSAVRSGEEAGYDDEKHDSWQNTMSELKPSYGEVRYSSTYEDQKGIKRIHVDSEVVFGMTTEQLCNYFDLEFEGGSMDPEEFFDVKFSHPYNGYSGFTEEVAFERFQEECPEEMDKATVPNPYWFKRFPENEAKFNKMNAKQLRAAINAIIKKTEGWMKFEAPEGDDVDALRKRLLDLATRFYG